MATYRRPVGALGSWDKPRKKTHPRFLHGGWIEPGLRVLHQDRWCHVVDCHYVTNMGHCNVTGMSEHVTVRFPDGGELRVHRSDLVDVDLTPTKEGDRALVDFTASYRGRTEGMRGQVWGAIKGNMSASDLNAVARFIPDVVVAPKEKKSKRGIPIRAFQIIELERF